MPRTPDPALGEPVSAPWRRWATRQLDGIDRSLQRSQTEAKAANRGLTGTVNGLVRTIKSLQDQNTYLLGLQNVQYSEIPDMNIGGTAGWFNGTRPQVSITSPTGRLEIGYGGSANGGEAYFCYGISAGGTTVYSRDTCRTNVARRVAVNGGANYTPTGWRTVVVDVPANTALTVIMSPYLTDTFAYVLAGALLARVAP